MASIFKRSGKWHVQIRRSNYPNSYKTFHKRGDAVSWARDIEAKADRGEFAANLEELTTLKLSTLINRYLREIVPSKKGGPDEVWVLGAISKHSLAELPLIQIGAKQIALYREQRLNSVKPATVKRQMNLLQHLFNVAITDWGIPLPSNPVKLVKKPPPSKPRNRRLEPGEFEALRSASHNSRATYLWPLVELAIQTGMRRGELLKAEWRDLDLQGRKMTLRDTKNGEDRTIPLTLRATKIISHIPRTDERLFPVTPVAVRQAWDRLRRRAGIEDLHFHDLRHEAISRFFEMGLSVPEVALISGHKDYRMLARYTHLRAEDLVGKLS